VPKLVKIFNKIGLRITQLGGSVNSHTHAAEQNTEGQIGSTFLCQFLGIPPKRTHKKKKRKFMGVGLVFLLSFSTLSPPFSLNCAFRNFFSTKSSKFDGNSDRGSEADQPFALSSRGPWQTQQASRVVWSCALTVQVSTLFFLCFSILISSISLSSGQIRWRCASRFKRMLAIRRDVLLTIRKEHQRSEALQFTGKGFDFTFVIVANTLFTEKG